MDGAFVALAIAMLGPLLSYLIAARRLSGRIRDTDATELWAESRSIREWSTARVKELHAEIEELEKRLAEVEQSNFKLTEENRRCTKEVYRLRVRVQDLLDAKDLVTKLLAEAQEEDPPDPEEQGGSDAKS